VGVEDELRAVLASPSESVTLDFKEAVGWGSRHNQLEIARDVVCLANRSGGQLVFGVRDLGGGKWQAVGLAAGDDLPDSTDLAKLIRTVFDPVPTVTTYDVTVDGLRYGLIRVEEFLRIPSVCKAIGNDESNHAVVRPGYFYRRSDALECSIVDSAGGLQAIVESSVAKTGAAVRALVGELAPTDRTVQSATSPPTSAATAYRFCDLIPSPEPAKERFAQILDRITRASVRSYGGTQIPRGIDPNSLPPSAIVREPDRLLIERSKDELFGRGSSLIEVSRTLKVRIREELGEGEGSVDYSTTFGFVLGCLKFAGEIYLDTAATKVDIHVGLSGVLGRQLVDDPSRFSGFHATYVATTAADLAVSKIVRIEELRDYESRKAIGRELIAELGEYFGFRIGDGAFDAHVAYVEEFVDVKGDLAPPTPLP
jgi:hypothetical protein